MQHYHLTVLTPIDYVRGGPQDHLLALEHNLDTMLTRQPFQPEFMRNEVPFAVMPMVHMLRFLIIDEIPVQMGNQKSGQLASKYLLFIAELDGDRDSFLSCFFRERPDVVESVWSHCVGFPENLTEHRFIRYIGDHEIESSLPYTAFPEVTQPQIQNMLDVRRDLTNFIADHQLTSDQQLYDDWNRFIDQLDALDMNVRERRQTRRWAP